MSEHASDARAVAHGEVEASDCTVTPANHRDESSDVEMIEESDGIAREVIVVKIRETLEGGSPLAAGASGVSANIMARFCISKMGC
jgi:hypothetical protein